MEFSSTRMLKANRDPMRMIGVSQESLKQLPIKEALGGKASASCFFFLSRSSFGVLRGDLGGIPAYSP